MAEAIQSEAAKPRLTFRSRAFRAALWAAWPAWLAAAGVLIAFAVGSALADTPSAGVRYAGTGLQLFGLGTVAVGLSQVRRSFGRPSLPQKVAAWFRQVAGAFRPGKTIALSGVATVGATVSGEARLVHRAGPEASLERRIEVLEQNLERFRDEFDGKYNKTKAEIRKVQEAVSLERQTRETETRRIVAQTEELAVGGLHLELVGLVWLALGVIGTSVPDELTSWLGSSL